MHLVFRLFCIALFPSSLLAQVPTVSAPVPKQGLAFYQQISKDIASPILKPTIIRVTVDTTGKCLNPLVLAPHSKSSSFAILEKLDLLDFFPGRWGANKVEREVFLVFSSETGEGNDFPFLGKLPDKLPTFHFHPGMVGWEKEKDSYLYYEHIHRHLYPPVGYEESDENGDFTSTIQHNHFPNESDIPDPKTFFAGKHAVPIDFEGFQNREITPYVPDLGGVEGRAFLRILVDKQGIPSRFIIIREVHPLFIEAVTASLIQLRFEPGIEKGKPVYHWTAIPFKTAP